MTTTRALIIFSIYLVLMYFFWIHPVWAHPMAEILNSYAWGNNPYWLDFVCSVGRTDCWT